jgi:translation initiation factor IF-1
MQRFELIEVVGTVTESLDEALFRVSLPNGHEVVGHLEESLEARVSAGEIECLPDSVVVIQLRAFDLSAGRILSVQPALKQGDKV